MVGLDRVARAAKRRRSVHDDGVGADALDPGAERDQEVGKVLHMRLGGGIAQMGRTVGADRGDEGVFGRGDAGLIEEDVGAFSREARNSSRCVAVTVAPNCSKARKCVSRRRRPMTSPPGGGSASPQRANSGPASRIEARIRAQSSGSRSAARISWRGFAACCAVPNRRRRRPSGSVRPASRYRESGERFRA